jgi:short-subunit dehydrogenase involved in D-alanine esterification of teichoic acids
MTTLTALEAVAADLPAIKTVHYASLEESDNAIADRLETSQFPFLLIFPFTPVDNVLQNGALETSVTLEMLLLDKDPNQQTVDFKASEIETRIVAPMRLLGRRFMHRLGEHSIIDKSKSDAISQISYQPTYSSHDAGLHGVLIQTTIKVQERQDVCV